jgi:ectoine hydroxylase-related dioxygenase (phytanoyl-CoA dioxygenase family)
MNSNYDNIIFIDNKIEHNLFESGYAILNILKSDEVKHLLLNIKSLFSQNQNFSNYSSIRSSDLNFKKKVNSIISSAINKKIDSHFKNHIKIDTGAILVKGANQPDLIIEPHMDPSLVCENQTNTYNLWIPLTDVNIENGCLHVYKYFNRVKNKFKKRPYNSDSINIINYINIDFWNNSVPIQLKAGQALLFNHKLPHASLGNKTKEDRIAISIAIVPNNSKKYLFYQSKKMFHSNEVLKYEVDYEMFYKSGHNGLPENYINCSKENYLHKIYFLNTIVRYYLRKLIST